MPPKFCNSCQEMCYSTFCPYCEKEPGELNYDAEPSGVVDVDEGAAWGSKMTADDCGALNFDDCFGVDKD